VTIYKEKQKKTKENDRIVGLWEEFRIWDHDSDVRLYLLMCNFTYSAANCFPKIMDIFRFNMIQKVYTKTWLMT
jgi:predicted NACHT family NTPase